MFSHTYLLLLANIEKEEYANDFPKLLCAVAELKTKSFSYFGYWEYKIVVSWIMASWATTKKRALYADTYKFLMKQSLYNSSSNTYKKRTKLSILLFQMDWSATIFHWIGNDQYIDWYIYENKNFQWIFGSIWMNEWSDLYVS